MPESSPLGAWLEMGLESDPEPGMGYLVYYLIPPAVGLTLARDWDVLTRLLHVMEGRGVQVSSIARLLGGSGEGMWVYRVLWPVPGPDSDPFGFLQPLKLSDLEWKGELIHA